MVRKKCNIHYIYKTTCNVTGKWYVGMHSTSNENDGYMGSGKILRHSIRKHGKDNHTKEILEYCNSREDLVLREIEIVNLELIGDGLCMNLKEGGSGGGGFWSEEHMMNCSKAGNKAFKEKLLNDSEFRNKFSEQRRLVALNNIKTGKTKPMKEVYDWNGKNHTNETKESISRSMKNTGVGNTNSQFGSCWITKDGVNKKIKKDDIDSFLSGGWTKGRITNFFVP